MQLERRAGSTAAFDKALAVTGTTREQLRRYIRDDLRITTYLNQRFGATPIRRDRECRDCRVGGAMLRTAGLQITRAVTVLTAPHTRTQSIAAASGRVSPPAPTSTGRCAYANRSSSSLTPDAPRAPIQRAFDRLPVRRDRQRERARTRPLATMVSVCGGAPG